MRHNKQLLKNILSDAHDLIEDEESWCQHRFAMDAKGLLTAPESDAAECWCAVGAIQRAGLRRGASLDDIKAAALVLQATIGHTPVVKFNDSNPHDVVLAKFEQAMEKL